PAGPSTPAVDHARQAVIGAVGAVADLAQGVEQGGLRPLMHARNAAHPVAAMPEAEQRRQEARRRAGILDKELDWPLRSPALGNLAAGAAHREGAIASFRRVIRDADAEAQPLETVDHGLRVLAPH